MSRHRDKGFSLPEVLIAMTISVTLVAVGIHFMIGSWNNQSFVQLQSHLKTQTELGFNRMARNIAQARRVFGRGTTGTAYIAKLDLTKSPRPMPGSMLPELRNSGSMSPEKNCEISPSEYFLPYTVGNSLLFAELTRVYKFIKASSGAPHYSRDLDVYRMKYVYVTDFQGNTTDNLVKSNQPDLPFAYSSVKKRALNLIDWSSVPIIDYAQLKAYYDQLTASPYSSEKSTIGTSLVNAGIKYAWKRDENTTTNAFYEVKSDGSLPVLAGKLPMLGYQDSLRLQSSSEGTYTIAYNRELSKSSPGYFPIRNKVPFYYAATLASGLNCPQVTPVPTPTPNGDYSYPFGFETMIIGPQSGRSVLMRITVVGKGYAPNLVEHTHTVTVSARDL